MSQIRLHERSFSETTRRRITQREGCYFENKPRALHNGLPTPPSFPNTPRFDHDSDSERSEADSEPALGAKRHTFKDSGYNTLNNTPAGSAAAGDEEYLVINPRWLLDDQFEDDIHQAKIQDPTPDVNWSKKGPRKTTESDVATHENALINDTEHTARFHGRAAVQNLKEVIAHQRSKTLENHHGESEVPQERLVRPQILRFSSDAGPHSSTNRRLGKFRQRFKFLHRFLDNDNHTDTVSNVGTGRMWSYSSQASTLTEVHTQSNLCVAPSVPDVHKIEPVNIEITHPAHPDLAPEERSSASPNFPPGLPSAIAALEIKHTASQPSSSLGRTSDSSRTLNTLSEGEMSFMGIDDASSSNTGLTEAFDGEVAECLEQLAGRILRRCLREPAHRGPRMHGGHQSGSSSSSSSSASTSSTTNLTPVTSATNTPVRPSFVGKGQDDLEDEGDTRRWRTSKRKNPDGEPNVRLFACPFAKSDRAKYSRENLAEPSYWNCGNCCLRDISRLKQHLYRVHSKPAYYCGSCFQPFKTREDLDQHARQRPPCEVSSPRYTDRMTDNQFQAIKRRVIRGDPYELWFNIFQILFPDAPKPASPYVSTADAATVNRFVTLFRWFGPEEMMTTLSAREGQPGHPLLDLSTQAVVDEAFEIALPDYLRRRTSTLLSAPPTDIQVRQASEVLDEDVLTMVPYCGPPRHANAPDELHWDSSEAVDRGMEPEMEDSIPRALAVRAAAPYQDPYSQNMYTTDLDGWPNIDSAQPQIQAAFNSYTQFSSEMVQPIQWTMQNPSGVLCDARNLDTEAHPDCTYHWTTSEMC